MLRWQPELFASRYDVQFSDDGQDWRTVRRVTTGRGGVDPLLLPDGEARYVRLALHDGPARAYAIAEVEVRDLAFGDSPNAFFEAVAREFPRGYFPRGFSGQQAYWTIVGVDGGADSGLLSEDGALEVGRGGFSIEPFVRVGSRVVTWANVDSTQSLRDGYLPIPSVTWRGPRWTLQVTAFASGDRARSQLLATYEVRNLTNRPLSLELVLAVRPAQVNPPAQFLNAPGGVAPISDIAWKKGALTVNLARRVFLSPRPKRVGTFTFDSGPVVKRIADVDWGGHLQIHDPFGYASATLGYPLTLEPGGSTTVAIATALSGRAMSDPLASPTQYPSLARVQDRVAALWRRQLNEVVLQVPSSAQPLVDTLRTAFAHLLITRDGPILRPGTRAYARSWIRDGTMIAESLMRLGRSDVAADYLRWYAQHQFADGKVPCCVDERGADPVPENDSVGEFVFLAGETFRYTGDRALIERMWPHVQFARLQAPRRLAGLRTNGAPGNRAARDSCLHRSVTKAMPPSRCIRTGMTSGRSRAMPAAIRIGAALGQTEQATTRRRQLEGVRARTVAASLSASASLHHIDYLPGSAELGDFDPAVIDHRTSRLPATCVQCPHSAYGRPSSAIGASSPIDATVARHGRTTLLTSCAPWERSCAWVGASARKSSSHSSWATGAPRHGINGPKWSAAIRATASICGRHAPCLDRVGLHPRRRSICSRTNATTTMRWCSPQVFLLLGSRATAFACRDCTHRSGA